MLAIFPELVELANNENIEYLSVRIRQYFGGDVAAKPMINMDSVIEGLGIPFKTTELGYPAALAAEDESGSFKVGMFFDVTVNGAQRRFLQAHMLGHFFFEYQSQIATGDLKKTGYRENVLPLNRYTSGLGSNPSNPIEFAKESLSDKFAAALLMPKGMLLKVYSSIGSIDKVAEIFGVTPSCVEQRLADLGAVVSNPSVNMEAERRLRGVGVETDTSKVSSDDVSRLSAPKKVSVIKDNKAKEFARSVAEENMLAMKSMNSTEGVSQPSAKDISNRSTLNSRVDESVPHSTKRSDSSPPEVAPAVQETEDAGSSALKRLRKLAQRIDSSVSVD
jgi:Zn-dependent peptidase ImmA (M78 family)